MNRLQYLINNDDIIDLMCSSHGVDKNTDEIKQCHVLKCRDCKFSNSEHCYTDMRDYLLEPVIYGKSKDEDKNYTSNFMEKFNRLV